VLWVEKNKFVYGDSSRIFVNTDMGCKASCQYCYLPSLNIVHGTRKITAYEAIEQVENLRYYKPGREGSIISIGCYSECMDIDNIEDTILLVQHFSRRGNLVQLATKKKIDRSFFESIIQADSQKQCLWIFVSIPVITNSSIIEPGTDSPDERIENFELCREYGVNSALYIKPYLANLTDQDINKYLEIVHIYDVPVVVGNMLNIKYGGEKVLVGEERLYEHAKRNKDKFVNEVEKKSKVYLHSIDCMR
jgi:DNA repair photolyase